MKFDDFIWYERHRPNSLAQMSLPEKYRKNFEKYLETGEIPHLLLYGPQGSGKTTMAFVLMNNIQCIRLVMNASSGDRGVEVMKTKVKQFASSKTLDGRPKFILFDEADGLTRDAQEALRGTIEAYAASCRFIFTCNEVDRIIAPLQSRCTKFEFSAFPFDDVVSQSEKILVEEGVKYSTEDVIKVVTQHYPDIRSVINNLQLCSVSGELDPEAVSKTTVDPEKLMDHIANGEVAHIRNMLVGITQFTHLYRYLFDTLLSLEDLTQEEKIEVTHALAEGLYRDSLVANKEINFIDCVVNLMITLKVEDIKFLV